MRVFYKKEVVPRKERFPHTWEDQSGKYFNFLTNTFTTENPIHPDKKETQNRQSRHHK